MDAALFAAVCVWTLRLVADPPLPPPPPNASNDPQWVLVDPRPVGDPVEEKARMPDAAERRALAPRLVATPWVAAADVVGVMLIEAPDNRFRGTRAEWRVAIDVAEPRRRAVEKLIGENVGRPLALVLAKGEIAYVAPVRNGRRVDLPVESRARGEALVRQLTVGKTSGAPPVSSGGRAK